MPRRAALSGVPTAVVAALSLVAGFAVAELTDVRALGGVVLLAGAAWCVARSWRAAGWWRVAGVVVVGAAVFVGSHPLGQVIGAWWAVAAAALVLGVATWFLVDVPTRRAAREAAGDRAAQEAADDGAAGGAAARGATGGMRVTESLLPFFGPAQVGDQRTVGRPVTEAERERDRRLRTEHVRVIGPDGTPYLVERDPHEQ